MDGWLEFRRVLFRSVQGGRGASIPQDQWAYFLQRAQESAASGDPRDPSYWGMRASGLYENTMGDQPSSSGPASVAPTTPLSTSGLPNLGGSLNDLEPVPSTDALAAPNASSPTALPGIPGTGVQPYTPGAITFGDIPSYSVDQLAAMEGNYTPGDLSGVTNPTALDTSTTAAAQNLLNNPLSLSDTDVERLKAQSKDEIAAQQAADENNLLGFSYENGLGDSHWLGAQRAQQQRDAEGQIIQSNRNIDLTAAQTRAS